MKKKILHAIIGHIPYWVYTEKDKQGRETKVYKCTLCHEELRAGVYNLLFRTSPDPTEEGSE